MGLCEDYPEETRSLDAARRDLLHAHLAGAKVLRIAFGWDAMEPERGRYDWSFWDEFVALAVNDYGIQLIPYICYTPRWAAVENGENFWRSPPRSSEDFARFVEALVRRYRSRIRSWELWNEPDNPSYWLGTREEFADLVRAGSAAVRRADPSANVVLGGIATRIDFLEELFRLDRIGPWVDVVNFHSYLETWHADPIETLPSTIEQIAHLVTTYGENEPIWMAEAGYSSVGPRSQISEFYRTRFEDEHGEVAQADALIRFVVLAASSEQLSVLAWYRINDLPATESVIGDDNNRHLGLIGKGQKEKPAALAFAGLAHLFAQPYRIEPLHVVSTSAGRPIEAHLIVFRDGRHVIFAWNANTGTAPPQASPQKDLRSQSVHLRFPSHGITYEATPVDWTTIQAPLEVQAKLSSCELTASLRAGHVTVIELRATTAKVSAPLRHQTQPRWRHQAAPTRR